MSFRLPDFSSSPLPSTPNRKSTNVFTFGPNNPSTTPAGPPPSSTKSFTPAGPPPSSFLGSSMMGTSTKPLSFSQQSSPPQRYNIPESSPSREYTRSYPEYQGSGLGDKYEDPPRKGFRVPSEGSVEDGEEAGFSQEGEEDEGSPAYGEEDEGSLGYEEDDGEGEEDEEDDYDNDQEMGDYQSELQNSRTARGADDPALLRSTLDDFGSSMLELRESIAHSTTASTNKPHYSQTAKDLVSAMDASRLTEPDDLILNTEALVSALYEAIAGPTTNDASLPLLLSTISRDLVSMWATYNVKTTGFEEHAPSIGPLPGASSFAKANFLASLILRLFHPQSSSHMFERRAQPLPQTLLEWQDENHDPFPYQIAQIQANRPTPSSSPLFWEVLFNSLVRGKVAAVIELLKSAGWKDARGGSLDFRSEHDSDGYTGVALANVERVVEAAAQALSSCPAIRGDWNLRNSDWTLFRVRISQTREELRNFAEGRDRSAFGSTSIQPGTYSANTQKAQSRVPWHIYQNLLTLYNLVMGDKVAITSNATDFCEATIGLLAWWDEGREDRKLALGRSQASHRAPTRVADEEFYIRKLRKSLDTATGEGSTTEVDPLNPVEVGIASIFDGDVKSVVVLLRALSMPLSSAVVEIGSVAGWLPQAEQSLITMEDLDEEAFGVLGINKSDDIKDETLINYSRALAGRRELVSTKSSGNMQLSREGWEIAIAVLGRLDSASRSEEVTGDLLDSLQLDSSDTVNKLWRVLNNVGMSRHAESTAEGYADRLAEESHKYGEALWYYALSHKSTKVKDVLDLLVSYSLIQSTAYPAETDLDNHLKQLIRSPKDTLLEMSRLDVDAAELLHKMLSGYATLRRFYNLRDDEVRLPTDDKVKLGARERKSEALSALIAVITSSDDNIRGGLYDEERGAVVSIDFLLALLGEAMVFLNQQDFTIAASDINILLKAIEDVQSVGPRVYSACTEFLQTVIASAQGLKGSSPADMLRKSTSNLSGTSSFSMVGSSMLASQLKQSMSSSGVLVRGNIKRGWDWRRGLAAGTSAEDLLKILRLGLAKHLARAWLVEADQLH